MTETGPKFFRFGIFHKILVTMLIVAVLPLSATWYLNYQDSTKRISKTIDRQLTDVSNKLVNFVDNWVMMHFKLLQQNAATPDIVSMDPIRQKSTLKSIVSKYAWVYGAITLAPDGMNVGRADNKSLKNYSDRIHYKQVINGAPMGKSVAIGKTTGKPNFIVAVPIHEKDEYTNTNRLVGLLSMAMHITEISRIITNVDIGETGYAFLLDEKGRVIAHQKEQYGKVSADFSKHPAYVNRPTRGVKRLSYSDINEKRVIAYSHATKEGWTMVVQQDYDEALLPVREANTKALILLSITLILVTMIAYLFAQRLASPIRSLTRIANQMSRGKVVIRLKESSRSDEIGSLARAIDRMGTCIKLALERLKAKSSTSQPIEDQPVRQSESGAA